MWKIGVKEPVEIRQGLVVWGYVSKIIVDAEEFRSCDADLPKGSPHSRSVMVQRNEIVCTRGSEKLRLVLPYLAWALQQKEGVEHSQDKIIWGTKSVGRCLLKLLGSDLLESGQDLTVVKLGRMGW